MKNGGKNKSVVYNCVYIKMFLIIINVENSFCCAIFWWKVKTVMNVFHDYLMNRKKFKKNIFIIYIYILLSEKNIY